MTRLNTVGVTSIEQTKILLFPNPTTGIVQWSNVEPEAVQVYDRTGRLTQKLQLPTQGLNLSGLPAGVYFLQIIERGKRYSARVLKE